MLFKCSKQKGSIRMQQREQFITSLKAEVFRFRTMADRIYTCAAVQKDRITGPSARAELAFRELQEARAEVWRKLRVLQEEYGIFE